MKSLLCLNQRFVVFRNSSAGLNSKKRNIFVKNDRKEEAKYNNDGSVYY